MTEIGNYLDGDLAVEVRAQLEQHLAHCRTCTVLVDSTRKTLKVVTDSGSFDLPEQAFKPVGDKIMARLRATTK
jgi:hypothetical protein